MQQLLPTTFTINGEPASKSNSRKLVTIHGRPAFIKSQKARDYGVAFKQQAPKLDPMFDGDVAIIMTIHYASRRPDLDETLILDLMQDLIYANDRQVKERHTYWALDKECPRTEITIVPLDQRAAIASALLGHGSVSSGQKKTAKRRSKGEAG
jgi:Holliday junction resolvase RusA-like endonuclease